MEKSKLTLYISMSLDGFIAAEQDDLSWLDAVAKEGEDYGYEAFTNRMEAYIVGRKTYEVILSLTGGVFPQAERMDCYVLTREKRPPVEGVTFYNGELSTLISRLKAKGNVYCDGGGELVQALMAENLIDEYIISVIPIVLGRGKRLFLGQDTSFALKALPPRHFDTGLTQLHYIKVCSED